MYCVTYCDYGNQAIVDLGDMAPISNKTTDIDIRGNTINDTSTSQVAGVKRGRVDGPTSQSQADKLFLKEVLASSRRAVTILTSKN
jgi:hypothetical protein